MLAVFAFSNNSFAAECNNNGGGLTPGMVAGIIGDIGFAINENSDFVYDPAGDKKDISTFNAKIDSSYGGSILFGYLMENGLEGALEVGYRQTKEKDKTTASRLESDQWFGMIRGTYYLDLQTMVYPYIMAGIGIVRSDIKATLIKDDGTATDVAKISDLKKNKLGYQAGVGLSTVMQSAIIGIGYKFFGVAKIQDTDDYTDAKFTDFAAKPVADLTKVKFGSINQNFHTVEAFIKMVF